MTNDGLLSAGKAGRRNQTRNQPATTTTQRKTHAARYQLHRNVVHAITAASQRTKLIQLSQDSTHQPPE